MKKLQALLLLILSSFLLFACTQGLIPGEGSTGDPPLIPHEVEAADNGADCLGCHQDGDDGATKVPQWHATLVDCRQCHVPAVSGGAEFMPKY